MIEKRVPHHTGKVFSEISLKLRYKNKGRGWRECSWSKEPESREAHCRKDGLGELEADQYSCSIVKSSLRKAGPPLRRAFWPWSLDVSVTRHY